MLEIQIFPLVSRIALPVPATAGTRAQVPSGYGVQEHCLPFTAATALGFLIPSPLAFGICLRHEVPPDAHAFRSPVATPQTTAAAAPVFYVKDDLLCGFVKNAFTLDVLEEKRGAQRQPGISFFDRPDQQDLFKLHLPYLWRTPPEVDALFLPALNRHTGLEVLAGLVEADWYANPVNLVLRCPPASQSVHVAVGDPIAQVVFLPRAHRRPALQVLPPHARTSRELRTEITTWQKQHAADRSAYKKLARSQHGRFQTESPPEQR
jgi:Family of unknown function (DUF6065)